MECKSIFFSNSHVSREVYECGSANQCMCRNRRCRVFTKVLADPLVEPFHVLICSWCSVLVCACVLGGAHPHTYFLLLVLFNTKKTKANLCRFEKTGECNNLLDSYVKIYINYYYYYYFKEEDINQLN